MSIQTSQVLVDEATEGAAEFPIFWLRGLVPRGWTKTILAGREPNFHTTSGGCLEDSTLTEPHLMGPGQIMATDGSGGMYPTNTTLRRVGWGLSIAGHEGPPIGWARGGIAGEQTVPRAELAAVLSGIQQTIGDLTIWSGSAYVVLGSAQGWGLRMKNNQDLWGAVRDRLASRPGTVQVLKVKGHATSADVKKGLATARQAFLNDCADTQAGLGAVSAQLPPDTALAVLALMAKATQVHKRIAEVAQVLFELKRKEFVKPARPPGPLRTLPRWEQVFLARAAASEHQVIRQGPSRGLARCTICSKGGKVRAASRWLLTKCKVQLHEGVDGQPLHSSHAMAQRQGVRMCQVCGFYSVKRVVKLLLPCSGHALGLQKADLERWSKGLPPKAVQFWPLGPGLGPADG
jgi:ribonuclease HI